MQNADIPWFRLMLCLQCAFCILHFPSLARAQFGDPIVEVVIEQENRIVTDPLIIGLIETTVGEPLSMRDVRETMDHLANLRRFDDIQPISEPVPGGVRLRWVLFPSHPVDRVDFRGTLGVSEGDLRRIVTDRFGRAPAASRAAEAAETLRQSYRRRGYPDARVMTRIEETHDPDRSTMIFEVDAGRRARIAAVQVLQIAEDEADTIIGAPDIRIGDLYDADEVEQKLSDWANRLKERGYYEARASVGADMADDAYLRVSITRGPRVTVAFAGDQLPQNERDRLVPVKAEGSADEDLLEDSKLAIEQYLQRQGYRDAIATYTRDETPGELTITFTITRGPHYTVDALNITGNTALTTAEVQEILQIKPGEPFVRSALEGRATVIQNVYRTRGYTRVAVEPTAAVLPSGTPGSSERRVEVTVAITEGPRTVVRSIAFSGNTVLTEGELRSLVTSTPGGVFSQPDVAISREQIELEYRNRGYEGVAVRANVEPTENDTEADIGFTITEGPQSIINHIIIVGNERTSTQTITGELLFREGDPVGQAALINSRARLAALGLFRRVDIQPLQHTGESRRDVLIQVEEADPTTFGIGGGAELSLRTRPKDGVAEERVELAPRGFLEIGRRNLWGKNRSVSLFTRVSLRSTDVRVDQDGNPLAEDATQSNPGFNEFRVVGTFREPRAFSTSAELLVTGIVEQAVRTTFNFSRRIVRAETGMRVGRGIGLTGRYSFERTKLFDVVLTDTQNPVLIDRYFPQVRISKFAGSFIRDTRDDLLDASRGTFVIVDGDIAARAIGSQVGFVQAYLQAFTYRQLPTSRRIVLALGARVGAARGFAREVVDETTGTLVTVQELPASERFFAGGDTSVRGFSLDRLGDEKTISSNGFPVGGNSVVVLNSELRVSILRSLQAVGFVDAGNVFERASDLDVTDLRPAAGVGVRIQIPFAPIRFDWGFNLDRRDLAGGNRERGSVFHISLGQAF